MKAFIKYLCYASITLILVPSCNLDDFERDQVNNNDFIKAEVSNEKILSKYKFNDIGKIAEYEGLYFYSSYSYNNEGSLIKQESAADPSMYSSGFIAEKTQLMTAKNSIISSYQIFKYDENEKYFTSHTAESMEPRLISKTTFKYDNKNNPFIIFNEIGNPGLYTNQNNTIETNTIRHEESPGLDKNSTDRISYEYNTNNDPTKVITENSEYEYRY